MTHQPGNGFAIAVILGFLEGSERGLIGLGCSGMRCCHCVLLHHLFHLHENLRQHFMAAGQSRPLEYGCCLWLEGRQEFDSYTTLARLGIRTLWWGPGLQFGNLQIQSPREM